LPSHPQFRPHPICPALARIATQIKANEGKSIAAVIDNGKLLHEAEALCDHREYVDWVKREFLWSHDTALNYRSAYELSQNPIAADYEKWDMTLSAFYQVAKWLKANFQLPQAAAEAVIEVARHVRVNCRAARLIYCNVGRTISGGEDHSIKLQLLLPPAPPPRARRTQMPRKSSPQAPKVLLQAMDTVRKYALRDPDNWRKVGAIEWSEFMAMLNTSRPIQSD